MKTKEAWDQSRQDLGTFLTVGDIVDEEMFYYFVEVLPPATLTQARVQIGEPDNHDERGYPRYQTLDKLNGQWTYTGVKTR